jgi:hypothetical protein
MLRRNEPGRLYVATLAVANLSDENLEAAAYWG